MTKKEKLIEKIFLGKNISYNDAEKILISLDFEVKVRGSHHNFRKPSYRNTVTLKKRAQLLPYQIDLLKEVLTDHGY